MSCLQLIAIGFLALSLFLSASSSNEPRQPEGKDISPNDFKPILNAKCPRYKCLSQECSNPSDIRASRCQSDSDCSPVDEASCPNAPKYICCSVCCQNKCVQAPP